jgi:hypothetical protein
MLSVIYMRHMLSVVMLNVVMLRAIMLNVVAPTVANHVQAFLAAVPLAGDYSAVFK